ncbi:MULTISPECIES: daptide biosynthesis intramembrane metalloprotease [unclassified Streptomyces]|uniref:daptide biosynthesis intramembrane metalloprotease n=1 Tax=unclassified Streptomyces TaxID=2593676 RepID=UPI0037F3A90C
MTTPAPACPTTSRAAPDIHEGVGYLPEMPALREGVEIFQAEGEDYAVVSVAPEGRHLRMGRDAAVLLAGLDGSSEREDVLAQWSAAVGQQGASELLVQLWGLGLLHNPQGPPPARERAFTYRKPLSFQFTLVRPRRLTAVLRMLGGVLARRPFPQLYLALLVAGVVAMAVGHQGLVHTISAPVSRGTVFHVWAVTLAVGALHELGHATALAHFGGRPRRMGVMLFYFFPAFFCDVSAGWKLGDRGHRVRVALSGATVNAAVAAGAAIIAALSKGEAAEFWWLLTVYNLISTVFNLLPFVKLDGYLALMGRVDVPFLRNKAISDARAFLGRVLYGHSRAEKSLDRPWSVCFGLAAMTFPVVWMGFMLTRFLPSMLSWGKAGAVVWLVLITLAGGRLLYGMVRIAFPRRREGVRTAGWGRRLAGLGAVGAAAGSLLCAVPVSATAPAGYVVQDGWPALVMPTNGGAVEAVHPGEEVQLRSAGLVVRPVVATAIVDGPASGPVSVPSATFSPVRGSSAPTEMVRYPLHVLRGHPLPTGGAATVRTGTTTLAGRLAGIYLLPPLRLLTGLG